MPPVTVVLVSKSMGPPVTRDRRASLNGTLPPLFAPELRICDDTPARSRLPLGVSAPVAVSDESQVKAVVMFPPVMARSPSIAASITPAPRLVMDRVQVPALLHEIAWAVPVPNDRSAPDTVRSVTVALPSRVRSMTPTPVFEKASVVVAAFDAEIVCAVPVPRVRSLPLAARSPVAVIVVEARMAPVTSRATVGLVVFTPTRLVSPLTMRTFVSTARLSAVPRPIPATMAASPPPTTVTVMVVPAVHPAVVTTLLPAAAHVLV